VSAQKTPPTLLPEVQQELVRAARAQLEHRHRRQVSVRLAAAAAAIAILLTAPPSAALGVSRQTALPQILNNG
jgi:hypothetical protein